MSARKSTTKRTQRASLSARATAIGPPSIRLTALLFAALLVLTLALAARAEAFVYWTDIFGGIGRANLDGTGVDKRFIPGVGISGIAVDAGHVYWIDAGTIGRANLDGTHPDPSFITVLDTSQTDTDIAVDARHLYWTSPDPGTTNPEPSTIGRANIDGTGVDHGFIAGLRYPQGIAVDAAHIYWGNPYLGGVGRANLDGTGVNNSFIEAPVDATGVAVDAGHVYWAHSTGAIGRANLDGTGVEPSFVTGVLGDFLGGVAVDAAHVYWANTGEDYPVVSPGIGRANLDGTGADPGFITGFRPGGVAVDALRSFSFGKVKRNKERGTARLAVKVPGPGEVELAETEGVKPKRKQAEAAGKVKLPIKPRGETKKRLNRKGKAKVKAGVTYTPTGGNPNVVANTDTKTVKLIER